MKILALPKGGGGGLTHAKIFWWICRCIPKTLLRHHSTQIIHSQKWSFTHFLSQNVASRIYALLSSNPPECQDWGKGGGGVKPILAMPRFSRRLFCPPLPYQLSITLVSMDVTPLGPNLVTWPSEVSSTRKRHSLGAIYHAHTVAPSSNTLGMSQTGCSKNSILSSRCKSRGTCIRIWITRCIFHLDEDLDLQVSLSMFIQFSIF